MEAYIIFKNRYDSAYPQPLASRILEGYFDKQRCVNAVESYRATMSPSELRVGWRIEFETVNIVDTPSEDNGGEARSMQELSSPDK